MELLHADLTSRILDVFHDVHRELGYGFLESVYCKAMYLALLDADIPTEREKSVHVFFRDVKLGTFRADLIVDGAVLIEIKATESMAPATEAQVLNYLMGLNPSVILFDVPLTTFTAPDPEDNTNTNVALVKALKAAGVQPDQVIIYCPSSRMSLPEAEVSVRLEGGRLTPLSGSNNDEIRVLQLLERHRTKSRRLQTVQRRQHRRNHPLVIVLQHRLRAFERHLRRERAQCLSERRAHAPVPVGVHARQHRDEAFLIDRRRGFDRSGTHERPLIGEQVLNRRQS